MIGSAAALALIAATPAEAQDHSMHHMPGMTMPAAPPAAKASPPADANRAGTDLPPGDAPAPPAPMPHYADRLWGAAEMARSREIMMRRDGGGKRFAQVMIDRAELQLRDGGNTYRWDGEGWFGGDVDRFVMKSEGEGMSGGGVDSAEVQALFSHAIGPYFNVQAGVRHDVRPTPDRSYAVVGVEGLAPYWFEVQAAAFLSTKGDLLARVEGYYDQRLTQRLVLQPRVEINLSAQKAPAIDLGSGLTSTEAGVRLRYEIAREFAPYVGVSWEREVGETARLARRRGDDAGGAALVLGIRAWF